MKFYKFISMTSILAFFIFVILSLILKTDMMIVLACMSFMWIIVDQWKYSDKWWRIEHGLPVTYEQYVLERDIKEEKYKSGSRNEIQTCDN